MDPAGLPALVDAIKHMHGCAATFVESVAVRETFSGATVWDGEVQVFDLRAHPTAKRAYDFAQAQMAAGTVNILTVLNTENALFSAQDQLLQVNYLHLQALVDLFTALGGGWQLG